MDYPKAQTLFATARNPSAGKPLANNTRLFKRGDAFAVRLHDTDVVTLRADGSYLLSSGGWKTPTTKARINDYAPVRVSQERGSWFVHSNGQRVGFADGMMIAADGSIVGGAPADSAREETKLRKRARKYAKAFVDALFVGEVPAPSAGDCLICQAGYADADHILSHFSENYFVPTLLARALTEFGASIAATQTAHAFMQCVPQHAFTTDRNSFLASQIQKCVLRWCLRQLGLPT